MDILIVDLDKINCDNANFNEGEPKTNIPVRLISLA